MKFENAKVMNFENAIRGMRNPKNSWDLSDSAFGIDTQEYCQADYEVAQYWADSEGKSDDGDVLDEYSEWLMDNGVLDIENDCIEYAFLGPNDLRLAQTLIKAGPEHRKFMRQIFVSVDITAPLYWWKEMSTYQVGTVSNSTSTMHKITSKPITIDCFELDDYDETFADGKTINAFISYLEGLRLKYLETKDVHYWKELIRWLPESWLQTRTITMNYENLLAICSKGQRRFHKLSEWSGSFINWARSLPYAGELIFLDELKPKNSSN